MNNSGNYFYESNLKRPSLCKVRNKKKMNCDQKLNFLKEDKRKLKKEEDKEY
jgi:hypothetical protein